MNEKRELPMDLRIFITDVTEFCNDKPDGVDKIFEAWLFDANLDVHICSFQANKECYFIGVTFTTTRDFEDEDEWEKVHEYMDEVARCNECIDYFDGKLQGHPYEVVPCPEADEGEDQTEAERKVMEEYVEYLQGNTGAWESLVE
jgi:hypothetical protein